MSFERLLPSWTPFAAAGGAAILLVGLSVTMMPEALPYVNIAFVGNSMQYYNDMPRLLENLADGHIEYQNSCLHGGASFTSLLVRGNGMYSKWKTGNARLGLDDDSVRSMSIYDWGACTVQQLLLGYDEALDEYVADWNYNDDDNNNNNDDNNYQSYDTSGNPCLQDSTYYEYLSSLYQNNGPPQYDFVVLNDDTRSPARTETRAASLQVLEETYLPWLLETGATPIFISTYAYFSPYRDMTGLDNIPNFTSLTYVGYQQYADMMAAQLPSDQAPRLAPVGLAFLLVWEEQRSLWETLFHVDYTHGSPSGTYLQALVVYHTIFGVLPPLELALRRDSSHLWYGARRMQPTNHRRQPFPTPEQLDYLYEVAVRICVQKVVPKSLILYQNGESADVSSFNDYLYRVDDLF